MGDYIKASELGSSHIGKVVRVELTKFVKASDILTGLSHKSAMLFEGGLLEENLRPTLGRLETTLIFQRLGEIDCSPNQKVAILD